MLDLWSQACLKTIFALAGTWLGHAVLQSSQKRTTVAVTAGQLGGTLHCKRNE